MPLVPVDVCAWVATAVASGSLPRMVPVVFGFAAACWAVASGSLRFTDSTSAKRHGRAEYTFVLQVIEELDQSYCLLHEAGQLRDGGRVSPLR